MQFLDHTVFLEFLVAGLQSRYEEPLVSLWEFYVTKFF